MEEDLGFLLFYADVSSKYSHLHRWKRKISCYYFFNYIPKSVSEEVRPSSEFIRKLIWRFKDNGISLNDYIAEILISKIKSVFSFMPENFTFVCIPASTRDKTETRYQNFMIYVCRKTGMQNGYNYVKITKEKTPSHLGGTDELEYECDKEFFKGRKVIVFDDVLTHGHSLETMVDKLEKAGAKVWAAFFLGRTNDDSMKHPWIIDEDNHHKDEDQDYLNKLDQ